MKESHQNEKEWEEKAVEDEKFKELLVEYKKSRGNNEYLSKRFTKFILKFCPPSDWEKIVPSRYDFFDREWNNFMQGSQHPSLMQIEEIEEILIKAYKYRSSFVHSAAQPPHQHPEASMNKFFEVIQNFNSETYETQISPTYELMLGIAKTSIIKWLRTKVKK